MLTSRLNFAPVNSLKFSPRYTLLFLVAGILAFSSCRRQRTHWYQKDFSPEERLALAKSLTEGIGNYYQGSPGYQLLLEEAKSYDPNSALVHREIGVPYLKRGIASAFPHYYGKAADLDPLGWTGWRGYLYLYFYRDYERALADFNRLDTITPDVVDYPQSVSVDFMRGICYLQLGDYERSLEYFDLHIEHETKVTGFKYISPITFLYRGINFLELRDTTAAITAFETGLELQDYNADLMYWLAKTHLQAGSTARARDYLKRAQAAFAAGDYNRRPYVEEFYQLYEVDLAKLAKEVEGA